MTENALQVFCCYAREDKALRDKLEKHLGALKRSEHVTVWHDHEINAGMEWASEIDNRLNTSHIILLLVSPDFINSDYCYSVEMKKALELHDRGEAYVIPIILRYVYWQAAPFSKLQVLPTNAKPLKSWRDQDKALLNIAEGIREVVTIIHARKAKDESPLESVEKHDMMWSTLDTVSARRTSAQQTIQQVQVEIPKDQSQRKSSYDLLPSTLQPYTRKLPVYLLLDCSSSMQGDPIIGLHEGMEVLRRELLQDLQDRETVSISVIPFASHAQLYKPVPISQYVPPLLKSGGMTALGAAFRILITSIEQDLELSNNDHHPLVVLITDGLPVDDYRGVLGEIKAMSDSKKPIIIALGLTSLTDREEVLGNFLPEITTYAFVMSPTTRKDIKAFFLWISHLVINVSRSTQVIVSPFEVIHPFETLK